MVAVVAGGSWDPRQPSAGRQRSHGINCLWPSGARYVCNFRPSHRQWLSWCSSSCGILFFCSIFVVITYGYHGARAADPCHVRMHFWLLLPDTQVLPATANRVLFAWCSSLDSRQAIPGGTLDRHFSCCCSTLNCCQEGTTLDMHFSYCCLTLKYCAEPNSTGIAGAQAANKPLARVPIGLC